MKVAEFSTIVNSKGQIELPHDLSQEIPEGKPVQVVLLWDGASTDEMWTMAGRQSFESAYSPEDSVYEALLIDDTQIR